MNSCSVRYSSATSLVAVSVIAGSLWMMRKSDESCESWLRRCRHRAVDLDDRVCLSVLAALDILLHEALGLRLEREAVADFGIEVCVGYVFWRFTHRLLRFFD